MSTVKHAACRKSSLALNSDGTVNDCTNPAVAGSMVTVFLNGFGVVTPALATGVIGGGPAVSLAPSLDPFTGTTVIATKSLPGHHGVALRERVILIWTR
jgi:uncharacterized protein (TIGR03437 family)